MGSHRASPVRFHDPRSVGASSTAAPSQTGPNVAPNSSQLSFYRQETPVQGICMKPPRRVLDVWSLPPRHLENAAQELPLHETYCSSFLSRYLEDLSYSGWMESYCRSDRSRGRSPAGSRTLVLT